MSLRDQLPYLGVENEDGSLQVFDNLQIKIGYWQRPNYERFCQKIYQDESRCAEILFGLNQINNIYNLTTQMLEANDKNVWNHQGIINVNPAINKQYEQHIEFLDIVLEIKEMIDDGIQSKKLMFNDHMHGKADYEEYIYYAHKLSPFRIYYSFNTREFLKWAQSNGFTLPSEIEPWLNQSSNSITDNNDSETTKDEFEKFIVSLRLSYENDSQINIHLPKKPKESVTAQTLGFKRETGRTWKDFLKVLQNSPDHLYYLDPSNKDANRKRLEETNTKLIDFFSKKYNMLPRDGYKLFKLVKEKGFGVYKCIFQVGDAVTPIKSDDYLKKKIEDEIERCKSTGDSHELKNLLSEGLETGVLKLPEVKSYFHQAEISLDEGPSVFRQS